MAYLLQLFINFGLVVDPSRDATPWDLTQDLGKLVLQKGEKISENAQI